MIVYLKNYLLLERFLSLDWTVKKAILTHFKSYAHIQWEYVDENRSVFGIDEYTSLPHMRSSIKMLEQCNRDIQNLQKLHIDYIIPTSIYYPEALLHYKPEVKILFTKGDKALLMDKKRVAIVGSRKPTAYGRKVAYDLARFLAKHNICVVSGMALGIDAQAHRGALDENGNTIAVLASGVNQVYPQTNEKIYQQIVAGSGLLLSEQFTDEPPLRHHFPLRNRIISAISDIVVIIEAGQKSGSLITAMHAMEQGKVVFALPGSILSPQSTGTNQLIYDGANPLIKFEHILESLGLDASGMAPRKVDLSNHSALAQNIYAILIENKTLSMDTIFELTMCEYSEIFAAVSELILDDLCEYLTLNEITLI